MSTSVIKKSVAYPFFDGLNWTFSQSSRPIVRPDNSALVVGDRWMSPFSDFYHDGNTWLPKQRTGSGPKTIKPSDLANSVAGGITTGITTLIARSSSWAASGTTGVVCSYINAFTSGEAAPFGRLSTLDFTRPTYIHAKIRWRRNGVFRLYWGNGGGVTSAADLSTPGFGFKIDNSFNMFLQIYTNGALTTSPSLGRLTPSSDELFFSFLLAWDGSSKLCAYINDVFVGSHTAALSGISVNRFTISGEADGGIYTLGQQFSINYLEVEGG